MSFKSIVEAACALNTAGITLDQAVETWKTATTVDIIQSLDNGLSVLKMIDYDVCILFVGRIGIVVMNHACPSEMGNYGLVTKFAPDLYSREIRVACLCCNPQKYDKNGFYDHADPFNTQGAFLDRLRKIKNTLHINNLLIQPCGGHLPSWLMEYTESSDEIKDFPLFFPLLLSSSKLGKQKIM